MQSTFVGRSAVAATFFSLFLAACGGGGDGGAAPSTSAPGPTIATQPQDQTVLTGGVATLSVGATGTGPLVYQWLRNGTPIPGANAATYTTPPSSYVDSGALYSVQVSSAGGGSATSSPAKINLALSPSQQVFESFYVTPATGVYSYSWNLNFSGPETNGTNYASAALVPPIASPLTHGPQAIVEGAAENLTSTLVLPGTTLNRYLINGAIVAGSASQNDNIYSYLGGDVRIDALAADHKTVVYSQVRSDYSAAPLSGTLAATPPEFAHPFNSIFANAAILRSSATYAAGSAYIRFTARMLGDRYQVFDCHATTTGTDVSACATGTTLSALLSAGYNSASDLLTYQLADGTLGTVGGVRVWVANNPRPQSATLSATVEYRMYFELNGKVYTGSLVKDGTLLGGNYYVSNIAAAGTPAALNFLTYQVRTNKAARDSLAAAMAI